MNREQVFLTDNIQVPLIKCHTIVVGTGAAGLNCAERLYCAGVRDIIVLTSNLYGGTSYCSGSDKQTYYKLSVFGDTADSPMDMAHSLFDGGCMHGDMAYVESLYSLPAFYHLVQNGVPFPYNKYGAFVGYKTDHDPRQRATSAGPRTSRFMVETSLRKVLELGIPIFDEMTVVKLVTTSSQDRICGMVVINEHEIEMEHLGITLFQAENIVLATGGPGELYAKSIYPSGQVSLHGVALEAGVAAVNLGESQFGLASTTFRWNLSGTYQQVIPTYFSVGADGQRRNFLEEYFRSLPEMALCTFLKGYQWPFSADHARDFGSSLIDIAVEWETSQGRHVYIDFSHNPSYRGEIFDIHLLPQEARDYLVRSGATQDTPYERLKHMNPDSIEVYHDHGIDLHEPLEVTVSFQHNNGGLWVDDVYQTNIRNLFAIGEVAGAHGVMRPGGTALNSGQVGGIRVAQYISSRRTEQSLGDCSPLLKEAGKWVLDESQKMLTNSGLDHQQVRSTIQNRMTCSAAIIRKADIIHSALQEAITDHEKYMRSPFSVRSRAELARGWETRNLLVTHLAFLKTIDAYISDGGGSRGAYLILTDEESGEDVGCIDSAKGTIYRFERERLEDRKRRLLVTGPRLTLSAEAVKPLPTDDSWFETVWADWRRGTTFGESAPSSGA